jgi:hypothetical protein
MTAGSRRGSAVCGHLIFEPAWKGGSLRAHAAGSGGKVGVLVAAYPLQGRRMLAGESPIFSDESSKGVSVFEQRNGRRRIPARGQNVATKMRGRAGLGLASGVIMLHVVNWMYVNARTLD